MKLLKKWFHKRREAKIKDQYCNGYNYAAGELLRNRASPAEIEAHYYNSDWTPFDRGCDDAINLLIELKIIKDNRI